MSRVNAPKTAAPNKKKGIESQSLKSPEYLLVAEK